MQHADFRIGTEFRTPGGLWRCADVGTRTVIAIRLDPPPRPVHSVAGATTSHILTAEEAEQQGWYSGPPYAVPEHVFNEDDLPGCEAMGRAV